MKVFRKLCSLGSHQGEVDHYSNTNTQATEVINEGKSVPFIHFLGIGPCVIITKGQTWYKSVIDLSRRPIHRFTTRIITNMSSHLVDPVVRSFVVWRANRGPPVVVDHLLPVGVPPVYSIPSQPGRVVARRGLAYHLLGWCQLSASSAQLPVLAVVTRRLLQHVSKTACSWTSLIHGADQCNTLRERIS